MRKRAEVLTWLYSVDYESRHVDIQSRRMEGTGTWFLETPEFEKWLAGKSIPRLLWGKGIRKLHRGLSSGAL